MEAITLNGIQRTEKGFRYEFTLSEGLTPYFSGKPFVAEYSENVQAVPDGVAAIPFVCSVLPIMWLTDAVLSVDQLDQDFYDCIPNILAGYREMYPDTVFGGRLDAGQLIPSRPNPGNGAAVLFSGGLDAVSSLITHLDEKPALLSVWGADIPYDSEEGWNRVYAGIQEYREKYDLEGCVVRSTFREFDREDQLSNRFRESMKDHWWHGIKHSLCLLGHMAPYVWLHGTKKLYIASSFTKNDEPYHCASNPKTDNAVRFAGARVIHDGYAFNRQGKIQNVVNYANKSHEKVKLHVCWQSQDGGNCCRCEKCYRTMGGLIAAGADPVDYGFQDAKDGIAHMHDVLAWEGSHKGVNEARWGCIQRELLKNEAVVRKSPYWHHVKFIKDMDFTKENPVTIPLVYRIRGKLGEFKFYQNLHKMKMRLIHREKSHE